MAEAWSNLVAIAQGLDAAAWQSLAVEHTRLFAGLTDGSASPPPFETVWRSGIEPGVVLAHVAQTYAGAGFADIDPDAGPQDHLGVELKFMAILALREAEAWQRNDLGGAQLRMRQQRQFLDRHLLDWVPRWVDALVQHTEEKIYLALARLILVGLAEVADDLNTYAES